MNEEEMSSKGRRGEKKPSLSSVAVPQEYRKASGYTYYCHSGMKKRQKKGGGDLRKAKKQRDICERKKNCWAYAPLLTKSADLN